MKNNVLADTSVWIEFFKRQSRTGDRLERLIKENAVWTCGIVIFELLHGVRSEADRNAISETLSDLRYVEMSRVTWTRSAAISTLLRTKGVTLPLSDIFIASLALENDLHIFTLDKHFEQIPSLRIYNF